MNKNSLNIFIGILVTFLVFGLILKLVPFFLITGVIVWAGIKVYGFFSNKKFKKKSIDNSFETTSDYQVNDDFNTSEAIDVDYKDV
ncbi:MAG: hypothetical protein PUE01_13465 [Clostridiaceae bacterium]|nr:hypothetical protein [Clostridiaceae bacterium]